MSYDLIIKNGMVIDGSGGARYRGDIGVKDGKIASSMVSDDDLGLLQQLGATIQLPQGT